jgi:serine/threonine protein phosphatase PrpC
VDFYRFSVYDMSGKQGKLTLLNNPRLAYQDKDINLSKDLRGEEQLLMEIRTYCRTHTGKVRDHNEDNVLAVEMPGITGIQAVLVVADGMGGHSCGEVASRIAIDVFKDLAQSREDIGNNYILRDVLKLCIKRINERIEKQIESDPSREGMGTTIVAGIIARNRLYVAWVGDSRAYIVRNRVAMQITDDHSYVNDLVKKGVITAKEAETHPQRNLITRSLTGTKDVEADIAEVNLEDGDVVILCTDGLSGYTSLKEIGDVAQQTGDPIDKCSDFVNIANSRGGRDNISVIVTHVGTKGFRPRISDDADDRKTRIIQIQKPVSFWRQRVAILLICMMSVLILSGITLGVVFHNGKKAPLNGPIDNDSLVHLLKPQADAGDEKVAEEENTSNSGKIVANENSEYESPSNDGKKSADKTDNSKSVGDKTLGPDVNLKGKKGNKTNPGNNSPNKGSATVVPAESQEETSVSDQTGNSDNGNSRTKKFLDNIKNGFNLLKEGTEKLKNETENPQPIILKDIVIEAIDQNSAFEYNFTPKCVTIEISLKSQNESVVSEFNKLKQNLESDPSILKVRYSVKDKAEGTDDFNTSSLRISLPDFKNLKDHLNLKISIGEGKKIINLKITQKPVV